MQIIYSQFRSSIGSPNPFDSSTFSRFKRKQFGCIPYTYTSVSMVIIKFYLTKMTSHHILSSHIEHRQNHLISITIISMKSNAHAHIIHVLIQIQYWTMTYFYFVHASCDLRGDGDSSHFHKSKLFVFEYVISNYFNSKNSIFVVTFHLRVSKHSKISILPSNGAMRCWHNVWI